MGGLHMNMQESLLRVLSVSEREFLGNAGLLLTFSPFAHPLEVNGEKYSLMSSSLSLRISLVLTLFSCANCPFGNDCLLGENSGSPKHRPASLSALSSAH